MKAQLQVKKNSALLHSGVYDIDNADDFGKACADVWFALRERQLNNESSIGALMEHLDRGVFESAGGRADCCQFDRIAVTRSELQNSSKGPTLDRKGASIGHNDVLTILMPEDKEQSRDFGFARI